MFSLLKTRQGKLIGFFFMLMVCAAGLIIPVVSNLDPKLRVKDLRWQRADTIEGWVMYREQGPEDKVPNDADKVSCPNRPPGFVCGPGLTLPCDPQNICTYEHRVRTIVTFLTVVGNGHEVTPTVLVANEPTQNVITGNPEYMVTVTDGKHDIDVKVDRERYMRTKPGDPFAYKE
jgi:hypothetical protein